MTTHMQTRYPVGDHIEERKLEYQDMECPARRFYPDGPSYCVDEGDDEKRVCVLEGGYHCDRMTELINEEN